MRGIAACLLRIISERRTLGLYLKARRVLMPHERSVLIDQLRALLTQQRYSSVVVHNYCRGAQYFLEYLARRDIAVDACGLNVLPSK
jgi:hypothetical protein